jgi:hypothetical protein
MLWDSTCKLFWPYEDMNVEDCSEEYDCGEQMKVADDESERFVEWALESFGLFQYSLGDGVLITISYISKAYRFQLATCTFLVTEYAPFSGSASILVLSLSSRNHNK